MSVDLYMGTPGSGKSLNVTRIILTKLFFGCDVISNYPIKFTKREKKRGYEDRYFYVETDEITVRNLAIFAKKRGYLDKKKESQCLVVIDEAGSRFNCDTDKDEFNKLKNYFSEDEDEVVTHTEYGPKDRKKWRKFFRVHRKFGYDFILIAQSDRDIDAQMRRIIERVYIHRKASNLVWWFKLLPFKPFMCIEKYYGTNMKTDMYFFRYSKKYGERYDTMKVFDGFNLDQFVNDNVDCSAIFKPKKENILLGGAPLGGGYQ